MFNASILFKTSKRDNIKYFNNLKQPIHLFFKGGTYFTFVLAILRWFATYMK